MVLSWVCLIFLTFLFNTTWSSNCRITPWLWCFQSVVETGPTQTALSAHAIYYPERMVFPVGFLCCQCQFPCRWSFISLRMGLQEEVIVSILCGGERALGLLWWSPLVFWGVGAVRGRHSSYRALFSFSLMTWKHFILVWHVNVLIIEFIRVSIPWEPFEIYFKNLHQCWVFF